MTAREMLNAGNAWTDQSTRLAFPIVLAFAMDRTPISYGDLNRAVDAAGGKLVMAIDYRFVAGKMGDVCEALVAETGEEIPPLNTIIVNDDKGLPSEGADYYIAGYFGKTLRYIRNLSQTTRDQYAVDAMHAVFRFERWREVARTLGVVGIPKIDHIGEGLPVELPNAKKFARGQEKAAHKKLKRWIADNPQVLRDFGTFGSGEVEHTLSSGDRLDAFFSNGKMRLAAEVKTKGSEPAEVERGVFQCIKYRATLRAMQAVVGESETADAVLVVDYPPSGNLRRLAKLLSVKIIDVSAEFA